MRKTNLLKGVLCGLLFTVVASSVVFGKTRTVVEEKGLWITEIKDYLVGTVGKYEYTVTKKDTNLITDEWMCSVVRYEILPLLEEYWFDEREKINEWREILEGVVSKK